MKKLLVLLVIAFSGVLTSPICAQESVDKLVMLNGDEYVGKVVEMDTDALKFVHENEDLVYTYEKADINKIQFSSGRIEVITPVSNTPEQDSEGVLQDHHNLIAIIPFSFIGDGGMRDKKLEEKVQMDCYNVLKKFATEFKVQNPLTTNALLVKNGVTDETKAAFTPEELIHVLGVEYIVVGNVTVLNTGSSTYRASVSQEKKEKRSNKLVNVISDTGSSSTVNQFKTQVDLQIFNDMGQNIFTQSHDSFWQTEDAYEITLKYLIKRSPLYRK